MQKLTLKMLQDLFLKAVREDKVTGDKSGIVRDAYQLKLSQAALASDSYTHTGNRRGPNPNQHEV